jgi:CrcB protein
VSFVAVVIGGAVGAVSRLALGRFVVGVAGSTLPWATLAVNVTGCLALGVTLSAIESSAIPPGVQRFIVVGVLGSFTTFSTFGGEMFDMLRSGHGGRALLYASGSVVLGLAALVIGFWTAKALLPGHA